VDNRIVFVQNKNRGNVHIDTSKDSLFFGSASLFFCDVSLFYLS